MLRLVWLRLRVVWVWAAAKAASNTDAAAQYASPVFMGVLPTFDRRTGRGRVSSLQLLHLDSDVLPVFVATQAGSRNRVSGGLLRIVEPAAFRAVDGAEMDGSDLHGYRVLGVKED